MIKHHPSNILLAQHCSAQLSLSMSIAISAHIEMCPQCQAQVRLIEETQAQQAWQEQHVEQADFGDMMQGILNGEIENSPKHTTVIQSHEQHISHEGKEILLPRAFRGISALKWSGFGGVQRARIINDESNVRASLLHIKKGAEIPRHQHKGYELTLLLSGSFSDEQDTYQKGDFILLSGEVQHSPRTEHGCLCYTVQDAPLHFTHGMSKVLNPLGKLIY